VLIAYVNTVFYQEGHVHGSNTGQVIDGAPLVEIILEDVLDIPHHDSNDKSNSDFHYDDYRPSTAKWFSATPLIKIIEICFVPVVAFNTQQTYVDFDTNISCLLGYYTYLFRLKPF